MMSSLPYFFLSIEFWTQRMNRERALESSFLNSLVTTLSGKCFLMRRLVMLSWSVIIESSGLASSMGFIGAILIIISMQSVDKQAYILREAVKFRIKDFITPIESPKLIFAHSDIINLFNFAYEFKFNDLLKAQDKLYEFEEDDAAVDKSEAKNLVFILHPISSAMATITSMVLRNEASSIKKNYKICFVPKIDIICVEELERLKVRNKVEVTSFDFGVIPFPNKLYSLELSEHNHQVDVVNSCVEGLMLFAKAAGPVKRIVGKGDRATMILKQYQKMMANEDILYSETEREDAFLVVIDRKIDLVTPLLTGHSYQALIDHMYGIDLTRIKVPENILGKQGSKLEAYRLYNKDKIYDELAHMDIIDNLNNLEVARNKIKAEVQARKQTAKTAKQYEEVTSVWGVKYEQANNHLSIINSIINVMNKQMHFRNLVTLEMDILDHGKVNFQQLAYLSLHYPQEHLLRLICLCSQIYPLPSFYTRHEKEILQLMVFDYDNHQNIYNLYLLQQMGLIKNSKAKNKWQQIVQAFDLLPHEQHSYTKVFVKYSALSVRFIQMLIKGQLSPEANALLGRDNNYLKGLDSKQPRRLKELYVFYVGGITYGEISCLRLLERELGIKIVILTTKVMNGLDLIGKNLKAMAL